MCGIKKLRIIDTPLIYRLCTVKCKWSCIVYQQGSPWMNNWLSPLESGLHSLHCHILSSAKLAHLFREYSFDTGLQAHLIHSSCFLLSVMLIDSPECGFGWFQIFRWAHHLLYPLKWLFISRICYVVTKLFWGQNFKFCGIPSFYFQNSGLGDRY